MYKMSLYSTNEDYQYGHGTHLVSDKNFTIMVKELMNRISIMDKNSIISITMINNPNFPGLIGSMSFNKYELNELNNNKINTHKLTIDDFQLYPDPNYRGEKDNHFWGTAAEYLDNEELRDDDLIEY